MLQEPRLLLSLSETPKEERGLWPQDFWDEAAQLTWWI